MLTVSGSGSASSLVEQLAPDFRRAQAKVDLKFLEGTDSAGGIEAVGAKAIDIAAVSRNPKAGELRPGSTHVTFVRDAAAFVAMGTGVDDLSVRDLKRVFAGKTRNWRELGGRDLPVIVLIRDEDESLTQVLRADVFGDDFRFARDATVLSSAKEMNAGLERTAGAIGYSSYGSIVSARSPLRPLAVNGRRPSAATLARGAYPYMRPLGLVYLSSQPAATAVRDYLLSQRGAGALRRLGYAPV